MLSSCLTNRVGIPVSLASHHSAAQAAAAAAVQAATLEQLREKLESGEPPEKKVMLMAEEQQRIMQHALQQNLFAMATQLPMNIKLNNRGGGKECKNGSHIFLPCMCFYKKSLYFYLASKKSNTQTCVQI